MRKKELRLACAVCGAEVRFTPEDDYVPPSVLCPSCRQTELEEMDRINEYEMYGPAGRPDPRRVL